MDITCNHCGSKINEEELKLDNDYNNLTKNIGIADRLVKCTNKKCQCEVLFNSQTFEVVIYEKVMLERKVEKYIENRKRL